MNWGELHKKVTLLTADLGLVDAVVYGARKGKMASACESFTSGTVYLYAQPGRDYYTLKDMAIRSGYTSLKSDVRRIYAGHAMTEMVLKMHGGDYEELFSLLSSSLTLLEKEENEPLQVLIQCIYRGIGVMGLASDLSSCPLCDRVFTEEEILLYSTALHAPACSSCSDVSHLQLYPGMRRYLLVSGELSLEQAVSLQLSDAARERIFLYLRDSLKDILGYPLQSLKDSTMFM